MQAHLPGQVPNIQNARKGISRRKKIEEKNMPSPTANRKWPGNGCLLFYRYIKLTLKMQQKNCPHFFSFILKKSIDKLSKCIDLFFFHSVFEKDF